MNKTNDLTGQRFGRLVATRLIREKKYGSSQISYECICDCGNTHTVVARCLRDGRSTSCGCYHKEVVTQLKYKHGGKGTPEYMAWKNMKSRCLNPNNNRFKDWGGRGVTIHESWVNDFDAFLKDLGPKPVGSSLDRINNNLGYQPGNCEWRTMAQQNNNRRNNISIEYNGEVKNVCAWAAHFGITNNTFHSWRVRKGWTMQEIEAKAGALAPLGIDMQRRHKRI
jgi:hypothetical protein